MTKCAAIRDTQIFFRGHSLGTCEQCFPKMLNINCVSHGFHSRTRIIIIFLSFLFGQLPPNTIQLNCGLCLNVG